VESARQQKEERRQQQAARAARSRRQPAIRFARRCHARVVELRRPPFASAEQAAFAAA